MVVEDDPEVRRVAGLMLEGLGYHVLTAEDASAGLEVLKRAPGVCLLLSDIALPGGVSGPEMVDEVRKDRPELKVLFMSGHGSGVVNQRHRLDRSDPLLMKPFHRRQLAQKVRAILDGVDS